MISEPLLDVGVLVCSVVVENQVDGQAGFSRGVDSLEEAEESLVAMPRLAVPNHLAGSNVQRGKQGCRAVPLAVVRLALRQARPEWQNRLRAIQRLNLALLIHAEYDRIVWRVQVETHNVPYFGDELWVRAELERLHAMGLEVMLLPDALDRRRADSLLARHQADAPVSGVLRSGAQGHFDQCCFLLGRDFPRAARTGPLFQNAQQSF